jgi:hypothetical protein
MWTGMLVFLASLVSGGFLGFLFGIPRILQSDASDGEASQPRYRVNTNLEQVSDWLTKILIGVGLVELGTIVRSAGKLFSYVGGVFSSGPGGTVAAGALIVCSVVLGFLAGYVVTRTWLTQIFRKVDLGELKSLVQDEVSTRLARDSDAMRLVMQQLDADEPEVTEEALTTALQDTSSAARSQVFQLASTQRRNNWKTEESKPRMMRVIPVLRALTNVDPAPHRHWGELGYALAESAPPNDVAAVRALDQAIERRRRSGERGWELYEFVRAQARLRTLNGTAPDEAARQLITDDVRIAMKRADLRRVIERSNPSSTRDGRDVVPLLRNYT